MLQERGQQHMLHVQMTATAGDSAAAQDDTLGSRAPMCRQPRAGKHWQATAARNSRTRCYSVQRSTRLYVRAPDALSNPLWAHRHYDVTLIEPLA